jgi:hypothetical protein
LYDRSTTLPPILDRISAGESLREICQDKGMPDRLTVNRWLREDEEIRNQYACARAEQAEAYVDQALAIAKERPPLVTDTNHKAGGGEDSSGRMDSAFVAWQRVQIDTLKWTAGKLKPKQYGEKIDLTHAGPNGGAVEHQHRIMVEYVDAVAGSVSLPAPAPS